MYKKFLLPALLSFALFLLSTSVSFADCGAGGTVNKCGEPGGCTDANDVCTSSGFWPWVTYTCSPAPTRCANADNTTNYCGQLSTDTECGPTNGCKTGYMCSNNNGNDAQCIDPTQEGKSNDPENCNLPKDQSSPTPSNTPIPSGGGNTPTPSGGGNTPTPSGGGNTPTPSGGGNGEPTPTPVDIFAGPSNDNFNQLNPLRMFGGHVDELSSPGGIVSRILLFAFPLAGLILFVMIVWGGFEMISGATSKGIEAGRQRVTAAVVGFLLLFVAYWVFQIVEVIFGLQIL